jgi:hypothetical protein
MQRGLPFIAYRTHLCDSGACNFRQIDNFVSASAQDSFDDEHSESSPSSIRASRIHDRHGLSAPSALNSLELEFVNF